MGVSVSVAALSAVFAYYCYILKPERPAQMVSRMRGLYELVYNKYFVDEFYFHFINPEDPDDQLYGGPYLVPTAPFVVVNMAFGAARVGFWAYISGLALGVLPKTAIVAFAGDGIMDALEGKWGSAALMGAVAIVLWIVVVVVVRRWLRPQKLES